MTFTIDKARELLVAADVFFGPIDDDPDGYPDGLWDQTLNMNDTWAWACADGEFVPDEALPEVARLFFAYGFCGVLYWVSERRDQMRSEFHDINRMVDFVRHEERIRREVPDSAKRAYERREYMLGCESWCEAAKRATRISRLQILRRTLLGERTQRSNAIKRAAGGGDG